MSFLVAHLSDLHLPVPTGALRPLRQLAGKRLLAYLAWRRKRLTSVPAADLLADIRTAKPDHIVVAGDLTNLALPGEFAAARDWLEQLGPPEGLTVVPGNHDATVAVPWALGLGVWQAWMIDDDPAPGAPAFPFLRRRGPIALIGVSSAVPTMPGSAAGRMGPAQLARLGPLLDVAGREGLFRILIVHHAPILGPGGRRKALRDRAALQAVLASRGAELVLHGHHHIPLEAELAGPSGVIPVIGTPQALAGRHQPPGWRLHRITREETGWRLETTLRVQDPVTGAFRALQRRSWRLVPPLNNANGSSRAPRPAER